MPILSNPSPQEGLTPDYFSLYVIKSNNNKSQYLLNVYHVHINRYF